MGISVPFLATGPRVEVTPDQIVAVTSWPILILTLGSWRDTVTVTTSRRTVSIRKVRLWGFSSERVVRFDQIREVAYSVIDHSVGSVMTGERGGAETFDVALTLHTGEEVPLMRFSGDGEYVPDVSFATDWLGDKVREMTDMRGNQQESSLGFVDVLCQRLGVPLGGSKYF